MHSKAIKGLYLILDQQFTNKDIVTTAIEAVEAGVDIIQYREKALSKRDTLIIAENLRKITADAGVIFIINDDPAIALAVDADGVHLGQDDLPVNAARNILGKDKIIGISTHNVQEITRAKELNPDYIAFGPIFQSPTKMVTSPHGTEGIKQMRELIDIPLIAIGGINLENVSDVIQAGADGVAVISAILSANDIKKTVMEFKNLIHKT